MYMLKLHYLADEQTQSKITGTHNLDVSGQWEREFSGELKVLALEAFGVAHILREKFTIQFLQNLDIGSIS